METVKVKPIANAQIGGTSCAAIGTTWRTLRMILYFENEKEGGYDDASDCGCGFGEGGNKLFRCGGRTEISEGDGRVTLMVRLFNAVTFFPWTIKIIMMMMKK